MPKGASSKGTSFSSASWGAWSVATRSSVPSMRAAIRLAPVRLLAQRRVHLVARGVERGDRRVGEREVVRGHLAGDPHAARLGAGGSRRPSPRRRRGRCGCSRPRTRRAPRRGRRRCSRRSAGCPARPRRLATAPSWATPRPDRLMSSSCSTSGRPVICWYWSARRMTPASATGWPSSLKPGGAELGHLDLLGQLLALLADGDRGVEADAHDGLALGAVEQRAEHGGVVDHRRGVRHGDDGDEAARGRRHAAGGDVLEVLAAGRAQVDVGVHEAGHGDHARCRRSPRGPPGRRRSGRRGSPGRAPRRCRPPGRAPARRGSRAMAAGPGRWTSSRRPSDGHRADRVLGGLGARRGSGQQVVEHRHPHHHPVRGLSFDERLGVVGQRAGDLDAAVDRARRASRAGRGAGARG